MHAIRGDLTGMLKTLPCVQQGIGKAGIEQTGFVRGLRNLHKNIFESGEVGLAQAAAGLSCEASLQQRKERGVNRGTPDEPATKDDDPHLEVWRLFDEHMLLCGEEPKKIAPPDLILPIAQQVGSGATRYQIQLKLCMVVSAVGTGWISVAPDSAIDVCREFQPLEHGDKK